MLVLEQLVDEDSYRARRDAAEKKAAQLTSDQWKELRVLSKTNLFFLCYSILGYTKLTVNTHGPVINWMDATRSKRFRLLLLPRGFYKTTLYTVGHAIQCSLTDDTNAEPWPYCLGTDLRLALIHEKETTAAKMLSEIQNHFLANEMLMALFPECIPDPKKHTINQLQFELPRKSFWKEETFEVMGIGARSQGNHYNVLKPDDLIGKEAKDSKIIMQSAKDWVDNIQSFLTSFGSLDRIDFTGTRWAHDDLYSHIIERYGSEIEIYTRAIEEKDEKGDKIPTFPEEYPLERLAILRKNRKIFSAQYLNDPDSDTTDFDTDLLRYWYWKNKESIITFDNIAEANITHYTRELDKLIFVDPAMSGKLGIVVTGTDSRMRIMVLEAVKDSFSTNKLLNYVLGLALKWQVRAIIVEKVLFSGLYEPIFLSEMTKRGLRFRFVLHTVGSKKSKSERISALTQYITTGQLYINERQDDLIEEMRKFGLTDDIHLLDALSMGPHYWRPYSPINSFETTQQASAIRDSVSGYTPM